MTEGDPQFELPGKVDSYLATLSRLYKQKDHSLLREVLVNGVVSIDEGYDYYETVDGGVYGHAITLTVPEDIFLKVMDKKHNLETRIATDINNLKNTRNEHVSSVFIEMQPSAEYDWREKTGVFRPHVAAASIPAEVLQRIWGPQHVRVFLSHKSSVKQDAVRLKESFARCGIAAFVAHEDIEPTEEWQQEIERALFSMDAMVALLSEDYHESNWTDQEVGVAIGRGVPLIPVRLGLDPYGLMGKKQGLGGCSWSDTDAIAIKVFHLLHKRLPDKSRLFECALSAYAASDSFADSAWKVQHLLSTFASLSSDQATRVFNTYGENSQNRDSFKGTNLLQPLLTKWTGKPWRVMNNKLIGPPPAQGKEIPF